MLEPVVASAPGDHLVLEIAQVEGDGPALVGVEVLEGDGRGVGAVQLGEPGTRAFGQADSGPIGTERRQHGHESCPTGETLPCGQTIVGLLVRQRMKLLFHFRFPSWLTMVLLLPGNAAGAVMQNHHPKIAQCPDRSWVVECPQCRSDLTSAVPIGIGMPLRDRGTCGAALRESRHTAGAAGGRFVERTVPCRRPRCRSRERFVCAWSHSIDE